MKENGSLINTMEKEHRNGPMALGSKEITKMELNMDQAS
jgi:hypothetical protein